MGVVDRFFATGVTPITLDSMTSGFNIATNLSLDLEFVEMMGFSSNDVVNLFQLANPKQVDFVAHPVCPIIGEVYTQVENKNGERVHRNVKQSKLLIDK